MLALFGGLILFLSIADMLFKQFIEENFEREEERETILDKVVLRKVYNKGFMFHKLDQYPAVIKGTSAVLGIVIAIYDVWLFLAKGRWLEKLGMAFVSAGAISNIFDRLVRGKVIDYIGFKSRWKFLRTLTANLADFYVAIGTVIVAITQIFK